MFMVPILNFGIIMTMVCIILMVVIMVMVVIMIMFMVGSCHLTRNRTDSSSMIAALCGNLFSVWMERMTILAPMTLAMTFRRMCVKPPLHIQQI